MSGRAQVGVLLLVCLVFAGSAYGQIRSATITGAVTDPSGGVITGAQVVVTNQETAIADNTKTTEAGAFTVPYLPAGTYTVTVKAPGFADYKQTGVAIATAQTVRVDVKLAVATVGTAVEISAQAATIQTDSSTVQGSIDARAIDILPNPTSNPLYYAFLTAGVVPRVQSQNNQDITSFGIGTAGRRQWAAVGINGGHAWTNDIQLDGLPVMSGGYNEVSVTPNTEGLAEVKVIANTFSAQYGHGQGIISMNTKSGTNQYHGELSYQLRNEALMANTRQNKANWSQQRPYGDPRQPFKVHELGGAIGGPVLKDRLFFFASYHWLRFNKGLNRNETVPTELERVGNFSQSYIRDESNNPIPVQIFDPWNVVKINDDLYQRMPVPNNDLSGRPDSRYATKWFSYYPKPNRTPDTPTILNINNWGGSIVQQLRRHNLNSRVDYRLGKHSIYGSGGLTKSSNITPRYYGTAPINDAPAIVSDKNPYAQIGDTIVISPTLVLDLRYGVTRTNTMNFSGNKEGWDDSLYDAFGVPKNIRQFFAIPGAAPTLPMTAGVFGKNTSKQSSHTWSASVTKIQGAWTLKYGFEARNLMSNYSDFEEATAQYPSTWFDSGGNFNFEYVTASGGDDRTYNKLIAQRGITNARYFLAAPGWWVRPGANVAVAFAQKYMALYAQQDWRASNKLTLNFGLRWDLQPGPTERYNRMSAVDLDKMNPFGYQGALAFPGTMGYSRNLWDTRYNEIGPRLGGAYQATSSLVIRGGLGVTYLPSNSGYFESPVDYGSGPFSSGTMQQPYGPNPSGIPAIHMYDNAYLNVAPGANPGAPAIYGSSEAKFDRHFRNGRAMQYNLFVEKRLANTWLASIGYSASRSANLMNRNWAINNDQLLPQDLLDNWAAAYIASNMKITNPRTELIANPFQPADGTTRNFSGSLGAKKIARNATYNPYPLMLGLGINTSKAWARYNSLQARVSHAFSSGFHMDINYTWAKSLDNSDTMEENQYQNPGGTGSGYDIKNLKNNFRFNGNDIKHRITGVFLFDLPFGRNKLVDTNNTVLNQILGGWQSGATLTAQTGFPIFISGATDGALIARPDRVAGVPLEVPKELQKWYGGDEEVTLPNGRKIKPAKNTFLKYYSGAFTGRVIKLPNGINYGAAQNWVGSMNNTLNELRGPGRFNMDLSLRRSVKIRERYALEVSAEASNLLNSSQQSGSYSGSLGTATVVTENAAQGLRAGMGNSATYGTIDTRTFNPREVVMNLRLRF